MILIEISNGQSINPEDISVLDAHGEGIMITMKNGTIYESSIPYKTFKNAINSGQKRFEKNLEVLANSAYKPRP